MGNPPTAENFHVTAWQKQTKKKSCQQLLPFIKTSAFFPEELPVCPTYTWECTYTWELKVMSSCHNTEKHGESKILPIPALSTAYYCCFVLADIALQYLLLLPFSFTQNQKSTFPLNQHSYAEMERVTGETSTDKGSDPAAFHVNDKNRQGSREQDMARSAHFCGQGKPQVSYKVYPLSPCSEPLHQWLFSSHSVFDSNKWI